MKTRRIRRFFQGSLAATVVGFCTFTGAPANAASQSELIYAVNQNNDLFSFRSDAPGTYLSWTAIGGLQAGEEIRGLDYWNGTIYGLGSLSRLYTINPVTGAATPVGTGFGVLLSGGTFGVDNGPSGLRVVSGLGQSLLVDRTTGLASVEPSLSYVSGGAAPRVDALAFDSATGRWYAGDTLQNILTSFDPATGQLTPIGAAGIDIARYNGLDISPFTSTMYLDSPAASSDPQANLYVISPATGMAILVGQIGSPGDNILVRGLTVVPEPSTLVLLALGAVGLLFARRRQQ
jgi:hypothetical protein